VEWKNQKSDQDLEEGLTMAIALCRPKYRKIVARLLNLKNQRLHSVSVANGIITIHYDGKVIKDYIKTPKHVRWIGDWIPGKPIIREHRDLLKNHKYAILMAVHEAIEKYVAETYGLPEVREAHIVANDAEYHLSRKMGVNWNNYGLWVEVLYRKEEARKGNR
jgi:hypothetical protein